MRVPATLLILSVVALALFYFALYGVRWGLMQGRNLLRAGDHEGALRAFQRAARLMRKSPYPWIGIAAAHEGAGRLDDAAAALDRAMALDPTSMPAFDARVAIERKRVTMPEVLEWLRRRASDEKAGAVGRAMALGQRGLLLGATEPGRIEEAIVDMRSAYASLDDPDLGLSLGTAMLAAGRRAEGIEVLWKVSVANEALAAEALLTLMLLTGGDDPTREAREKARAEAGKLHAETPEGALVKAFAAAEGGDSAQIAQALAVSDKQPLSRAMRALRERLAAR